MLPSRTELLAENVALREEIEQLRAAILLWRDLYELINTRCAERKVEPSEEPLSQSAQQERAIVEACGPGFQHLASICIEEGLSLKTSTRIADCVRTMQDTTIADAARLFSDVASIKDGFRQ